MITSMRDNSMKGINMANKCKLVLLLMLLGCGEMVWGGASYTVRVKAAKSPENAGYIYISTSNTKPTTDTSEALYETWKPVTEGNGTFYFWADPSYGYKSVVKWNGSTNVQTTKGSSASVSFKAKFYTKNYTENYTVIFTPEPVSYSTTNTAPQVSWKKRTATGQLIFNLQYAQSAVSSEKTENGWSISAKQKNDLSSDYSFALPTTYTIDPLTTIHGENSVNVSGVATGFPSASGTKETKTLQGTALANADLTPTFTVSESAHSFGEIVPNTSTEYTFQQPATDFPNPQSQVVWVASVSGEGYEVVNIPTNGSVTIRFTPTEAGKEYPATLTLTATWTDAVGTKVSYSQEIQLQGKGLDNTLPGEIHILKEETEQTTASYEWLTSGSISDEFAVSTQAMGTLTAESNSPLVVPALSADQTVLSLVCSSPAEVGEEAAVVTVRGNELNGEQGEVEATLNITLRRWFNDIVLSATSDVSKVTLYWTDGGSNVASYEVWRDGVKLVSGLSAKTLTYTNSGLSPETTYTYTVKAKASNGKETAQTIAVTTAKAGAPAGLGNLSLYTCLAFENLTGIDATAAFLQDGTTTMDRLYLFSKKNAKQCYIYEKQDGDNTSYLWQRTVDPSTPAGRAGRITDSKIYIAGTCEKLCWAAGDSLGWLQPVNSDIYLDNARLQTASTNAIRLLCDETIDLDNNASGVEIYRIVPFSAAVFYLPEGNTSIHLLGNNYLGGGLAKNMHLQLTVKKHMFKEVTRTVHVYKPNYSAPIAMKDAHMFENNVQSPIQCNIDATWTDGAIGDGYLDLSARVCQYNDSASLVNKYTPKDGDVAYNAYVYWTNYRGYRYETPLYTGGDNGTYVINGGRINLWPANGQCCNVELQNLMGAGTVGELLAQQLSLCAGKSANYMACGSSYWTLVCDKACFDGTGVSNITPSRGSSADNILKEINRMNPAPRAGLYGLGDGYPLGKLIVNGGTITAQTDENSFAYHWTDWDAINKKAVQRTSKNVADDGTGQPLFAPNVQVNGGTFLTPLYGTTMAGHGTGTGKLYQGTWNQQGITDYAEGDYKSANVNSEQVYRSPVEMLAANTDYTGYRYSSSDLDKAPQDTTLHAVLANPSKSTEYPYGMNNVWSDADSRCWFYFPKDAGGNASGIVARNYWVQADRKITGNVLRSGEWIVKPYNLTVEQGGEILVDNGFKVWGQPAFCPEIASENRYQALCLPFTADEFFATDPADPHFRFYSYVEPQDNTNDAERKQINSNAYCYLYFLDDGNGNQTTHGINEVFRQNYHTHADGTTMQQGKTYILKFPSVQGDEGYWTRNKVTLRGAKGQIVNGASAFAVAQRPAADLDFTMDGNPTFVTQTVTGEYYVLDPDTYGDDSFHAATIASLQPVQGYVLGNEQTMQVYRVLGRNTTAVDNLSDIQWQAYGAENSIWIQTQEPCEIAVYTAEGRSCGNYSLEASSLLRIPATAGIWLVRNGAETRKVVVY